MNQNRKAPVVDPTQIYSALRLMIGKEYIFKGSRINILDVTEVNEGLYIMTSLINYTMTYEKSLQFVAECYPVENIQPQAATTVPPQSLQPASRTEGMLDNMTEALFETFQNIKNNPTRENIEQATALSNTANTISNMLKLKIQAQKIVDKPKF